MNETRRGARAQGGQVIVLYALTFLLIAFMTLLTIAVGTRVREKIKVQATADAAAYSLAVAQARALNVMAWVNRGVVAEYVSMLSVVGFQSYVNYWEGTFLGQVNNWGTIAGNESAMCATYRANLAACAAGSPACNPALNCLRDSCAMAGCAQHLQAMWRYWNPPADSRGVCIPGAPARWPSYDCLHGNWHVHGQGKHRALNDLDNAYVGAAKAQYQLAKQAPDDYLALSRGQAFADAMSHDVDNSGRFRALGPVPAPGTPPITSPATQDNFRTAVELWQPDPAPAHWGVYHEVLSGTRTDWIASHSWAGNGILDINISQQNYVLNNDPACASLAPYLSAANRFDDSGGSMTMLGPFGNLMPVNHHGNAHRYASGTAHGEGGRYAGSAEDHGTTATTFVDVDPAPLPACTSTSASWTQPPGSNQMFESPACSHDSRHVAGDGFIDGAADGYEPGIVSGCGLPGISVGTFRFRIQNAPDHLWNQPFTFASLTETVPPGPWDFDLAGKIGGSLLQVEAGRDASGAPQRNTGSVEMGADLRTKAYDSRVYPQVSGLAAGLSYYHNPGNVYAGGKPVGPWAEVPNVWNPFWRAKLDMPKDWNLAERDLEQIRSCDDQVIAQRLGYSGPSTVCP